MLSPQLTPSVEGGGFEVPLLELWPVKWTSPNPETDIDNIQSIALADVTDLLQQGKTITPSERRAFVRAVFAFVESMLFAMKYQLRHYPLTDIADALLLSEETYEIDGDGEIRTQKAKLPLKSNVKFTFKCWARVTRTKPTLKLGDNGWHKFQLAIKIRDRLMHPKSVSDFNVSDEELEHVTAAFFWFWGSVGQALAVVMVTWGPAIEAYQMAKWRSILLGCMNFRKETILEEAE